MKYYTNNQWEQIEGFYVTHPWPEVEAVLARTGYVAIPKEQKDIWAIKCNFSETLWLTRDVYMAGAFAEMLHRVTGVMPSKPKMMKRAELPYYILEGGA